MQVLRAGRSFLLGSSGWDRESGAPLLEHQAHRQGWSLAPLLPAGSRPGPLHCSWLLASRASPVFMSPPRKGVVAGEPAFPTALPPATPLWLGQLSRGSRLSKRPPGLPADPL